MKGCNVHVIVYFKKYIYLILLNYKVYKQSRHYAPEVKEVSLK